MVTYNALMKRGSDPTIVIVEEEEDLVVPCFLQDEPYQGGACRTSFSFPNGATLSCPAIVYKFLLQEYGCTRNLLVETDFV